jgi:hypothetical protein
MIAATGPSGPSTSLAQPDPARSRGVRGGWRSGLIQVTSRTAFVWRVRCSRHCRRSIVKNEAIETVVEGMLTAAEMLEEDDTEGSEG